MPSFISRRAWLKGCVGKQRTVIRPPWAVLEQQFVSDCTRCGQCISQCPENILQAGDGGFPEVNFAVGECTFCAACVDVCNHQALQRTDPPWNLRVEISDNCLTYRQIVCMSCAENCEAQAIYFSRAASQVPQPRIEADQCTGCGACYNPCPVQAISLCRK